MEFDSDDATLNRASPTVSRDSRFDSSRPLLMSSQENSADTDSIEEAPAAALRSLDSNRPSMASLPPAETDAEGASGDKPLLTFDDDFVPPSASTTSKPGDSEKPKNQPNIETIPHPKAGSSVCTYKIIRIV